MVGVEAAAVRCQGGGVTSIPESGSGHSPAYLMRLPEVLKRTAYSKPGWYKAIARGKAPAPVHRGGTSLWVSTEVEAFVEREIESLIAARKRTAASGDNSMGHSMG